MVISSSHELEIWRARNSSSPIVFTSGVFDLIHAGHIHLVQEIKRSAPSNYKFLIAIHSDKYVKINKGKDRPIFNQYHRALLLDNIKGVDDVIIWDGWENIVDLVELLTPQILATTTDKINNSNWENSWENVAKRINSKLIGINKVTPDISSTKFLDKISKIISE